MLQHIIPVFILSKLEDIKVIILTIRTPVILRRLERIVHLVEPCTYKRGILCDSRHNTATTVIATGKGTILRRNVSDIGSQRRKRHPSVEIINNVGIIPAEAYAVTS